MLMWLAQWLQGLSPDLGFLRVFQYLTLRAPCTCGGGLLLFLCGGDHRLHHLFHLHEPGSLHQHAAHLG